MVLEESLGRKLSSGVIYQRQDGGPPPGEPLVLWQPPEGEAGAIVDVDPMLTRWLRPHQREGVQFMFDCVCGLRSNSGQGVCAAASLVSHAVHASGLLPAADFSLAGMALRVAADAPLVSADCRLHPGG